MREILFRAKPRDLAHEQLPNVYAERNLDFVYGTGIYNDGVNTWLILSNDNKKPFAQLESLVVIPETVGQFTGLHDINGKRIFEGDIVKVHDAYKQHSEPNHEFTGVVEFDNASFLINQDDCVKHYRWMDYECEVVSNIHDNPELLKGE